jgi:hypothetical protein
MKARHAFIALAVALGGFSASISLQAGSSYGGGGGGGVGKVNRPTVKVSVTATGVGRLHYRWRSSDGSIVDQDSASTNWTLPSGPGLHLAYVLVSDSKGGYSESRVAVNTDTLGTLPESLVPGVDYHRYVAPPASAPVNQTFRGFVYVGASAPSTNPNDPGVDALTPGVKLFLTDGNSPADPTIRYPAAGTVTSGSDGSFLVPNVPTGTAITPTQLHYNCSFDGGSTFLDCGYSSWGGVAGNFAPTAYTEYEDNYPDTSASLAYAGRAVLADLTSCGTQNDYFGVHATGTATILDNNRHPLRTTQINEFGDWSVVVDPASNPTYVRFRCEGVSIAPVTLPPNTGLGSWTSLPKVIFAGTSRPVISAMTAPLTGAATLFLPEPSAVLPPVPAGGLPTTPAGWAALGQFPSDYQVRSRAFLAFKGIDSRQASCQYYRAIGAVRSCDSAGNYSGAINFEDWKRAVKIGPYATAGAVKAASTYINKVDLNVTREHTSVRYGTDKLAAVVCNHLGAAISSPLDFAFDPLEGIPPANDGKATVDTAVSNAINQKNLIACVAMDYAALPGVNGGKKFTRFLIFGPSGELIPSINLDGHGEKYMPGACVTCHGGDNYVGHFPTDGTGPADIGGRFLPYDLGNFQFSDVDGLTPAQREEGIYGLNQNLLLVDPLTDPPVALTAVGRDLTTNWYTNPALPAHTFDKEYVPTAWANNSNGLTLADGATPAQIQLQTDFYAKVQARSCRTCHVNQAQYAFDSWNDFKLHDRNICGNASYEVHRQLVMPNSLVTFNRMWLSQDSSNPTSSTDQMRILADWWGLGCDDNNSNSTYPVKLNPPLR